jgi:hypothetical protein
MSLCKRGGIWWINVTVAVRFGTAGGYTADQGKARRAIPVPLNAGAVLMRNLKEKVTEGDSGDLEAQTPSAFGPRGGPWTGQI